MKDKGRKEVEGGMKTSDVVRNILSILRQNSVCGRFNVFLQVLSENALNLCGKIKKKKLISVMTL